MRPLQFEGEIQKLKYSARGNAYDEDVLFFWLFILSLFSVNSIADDITEFDYPFLLGNWYWFSNQQEGSRK